MIYESVARAIIIVENQVLVCKHRDFTYTFLPGGHIENGETPKQALIRELWEELGILCLSIYLQSVVTLNNFYHKDGENINEQIYLYEVNYSDLKYVINGNFNFSGDDVEYFFTPIEQLDTLLPASLRSIIKLIHES